jgi:hypothetical protein
MTKRRTLPSLVNSLSPPDRDLQGTMLLRLVRLDDLDLSFTKDSGYLST